MLWTTLRWNWGNTSTVAAVFFLPFLTTGYVGGIETQFTSTRSLAELQYIRHARSVYLCRMNEMPLYQLVNDTVDP